MKTYWINESIIGPDGESMPRGFEIQVDGEIAKLIVPSDVQGDTENLYEEEIKFSQQKFVAKYDDGTPVHVEDGELIGE